MSKMAKITKDAPPLDAWRLDEILEPQMKPRERLWGAEAIAEALGVSVATVYRWAADPACTVPISRPKGRYFALRSEILSWLQGSARY